MESEIKVKLKIYNEKCKGCKLCVDVCPQNVLEMDGRVNKKGMQYIIIKNPEKCTQCGLCALVCPDCAIELIEEDK